MTDLKGPEETADSAWAINPVAWCQERLNVGHPVSVGVAWFEYKDWEGGHIFTLWGITPLGGNKYQIRITDSDDEYEGDVGVKVDTLTTTYEKNVWSISGYKFAMMPKGVTVCYIDYLVARAGGVRVSSRNKIHQNEHDLSTGLRLKAWQKEDNIDILTWDVTVTGATVASMTTTRGDQPEPSHSRRETTDGSGGDADNGRHAVDIEIHFTPPGVPRCNEISVDIVFCLTDWDTIRLSDVEWTATE